MHVLRLSLLCALALFAPIAGADAAYVRNAAEIVAAADWNAAQTVTVNFDEYGYDPDALHFQSGRAYKLVLKNQGSKKHYFTAPEFFRSIATRKIQSNRDGEIKAPYLLAIELMPEGGQLDLYFVAVQKGEYEVYCTLDKHRDEGMEGLILVD